MPTPDASLARPSARPPSQGALEEENEKFFILAGDPRNRELRDDEFASFVEDQAQRAADFENGLSDRGVDGVFRPQPALAQTEIFDAVGVSQPNEPVDVASTKDAITALGFGRFDRTLARSTEATPEFFDAVETSQRRLGVTEDGFMRPGGETNTAMKSAMARKAGVDLNGDVVPIGADGDGLGGDDLFAEFGDDHGVPSAEAQPAVSLIANPSDGLGADDLNPDPISIAEAAPNFTVLPMPETPIGKEIPEREIPPERGDRIVYRAQRDNNILYRNFRTRKSDGRKDRPTRTLLKFNGGHTVARDVFDRGLPLGFKSYSQFWGFHQALTKGVPFFLGDRIVRGRPVVNLAGTTLLIGVMGSSVQGRRNPDKGGYFGDGTRPSDYDIAIINRPLLENVIKRWAGKSDPDNPRGTFTLPGHGVSSWVLTPRQLKRYGLLEIIEGMPNNITNGRDVKVKIFRSLDAALKSGPVLILNPELMGKR